MSEILEKTVKKNKNKAEKLLKSAAAAGEKKSPTLAQKRAKKRKRLAEANTQTVILETDVRKFVAAEARLAGMDTVPYLQKIIENHVIQASGADDELGKRIMAKRAVLDRVVELAREMDAAGQFGPHFIMNVVRQASSEATFIDQYEIAIGADGDNKQEIARAQIPINQQMGRLIKRASGARSKRDDTNKIQRAQVQGEIISTYTLLEKPQKES